MSGTDHTTEEDLSPEDPDALVRGVIEAGNIIYDRAYERLMEELQFCGKTLREWAGEYMIEIPLGIDHRSFRELSARLGNLYQRAQNYHDTVDAAYEALVTSRDLKKDATIHKIVTRYRDDNARRPAGTIIEQMAEHEMRDVVSTAAVAKILKGFWKRRLEMLLDTRKTLDSIGMSLHVELKFLND